MRNMHQLFSGLRFRLVVLVLLAALPPVVLTLHMARQDRQRQTEALRQRSQDIVKLAARKEDEMIAGTRQLLRTVAESSQVRSAQWANCTKMLRTLFADYPRYANLGVIKTNGDVSASALPLTEPVNLADRSFFQRALATRDLSIGDYQVGRITGKPSINLGYPVLIRVIRLAFKRAGHLLISPLLMLGVLRLVKSKQRQLPCQWPVMLGIHNNIDFVPQRRNISKIPIDTGKSDIRYII